MFRYLPKGIITASAPDAAQPSVLLYNAAVLSLFVVQHLIMARNWFKKLVKAVFPWYLERSWFVAASGLALHAQMVLWKPTNSVIYNVKPPLSYALWTVAMSGWLFMLYSTCLIDHFDLVIRAEKDF